MKRIRKYFNWPSRIEAKLIADGCDKILKLAEEYSFTFYKEEEKRKKDKDSICPKCDGKEIVDKISRVEGSGSVSGSFRWGGGSIYGSSSTDTNEVNHCNKCGNQWKKYDRKYKSKDQVIADWLNDLNTVFEGKYTFGEKTVELLKDIPAECLYAEVNRVSDIIYFTTGDNITLSYLRTKFKSVYDV